MVGYRRFGTWLQRGIALDELPDLGGKVVLVTGGTAGVGRALVQALAGCGATVAFTARDREKGQRVLDEVRDHTGNREVHVVEMDLADLSSVRAGAATVLDRWERLDLLMANAGHLAAARAMTRDGLEMSFGVNHVAHAQLIWLLEDRLRASAPSRIVVVASEAHRRARRGIDFDDLDMSRGAFKPRLAYNRSKLANVLFVREAARRLQGTGVEIFAVHPGGVDTAMLRGPFDRPVLRALYPAIARVSFLAPEAAADGVLRVALDDALAGTSGSYFELGVERQPGDVGLDDAAAARLWEVTTALVEVRDG